MAKKDPSAYELFVRFAPKFREITWKDGDLHKHNQDHRLSLVFAGKEKNVYRHNNYCSIDLKAAGVSFECTYDPALDATPKIQLIDAAFKAVMAGPLAGRKFYMEPQDPNLLEGYFAGLAKERRQHICVSFFYEGEPIVGLTLMKDIQAEHWSFFIPADSKEGKIVEAAVKLEQAKYQQDKLQKREEPFPSVGDRQRELAQALEAVAA